MNDFVWTDLEVGMKAEFSVLLTSAMMQSFSLLSGDVNPLHCDEEFAKRAGYASQVVFGMLTSAFYSQLIGVHLPGRHVLLHGIDVHFSHPAYVGDTVTISGEISYLNKAYKRVELKAAIRNQEGILISKAVIRTGMHNA